MDLLIGLLIIVLIVWLTQTLLGAFKIKEPANQIIFVVVLVLCVLWLATGRSVGITFPR